MLGSLFRLISSLALLLTLLMALLACGRGLAAEPVLYLHTEFLPYPDPAPSLLAHRLEREVIRQALLMAARHELGITCYDQTLDEPAGSGDQVVSLILSERGSTTGNCHVKLYRYDDNWRDTDPIWEKQYQTNPAGSELYAMFIPLFEQASRDDFVEALKLAGLEKQPAKPPSDPPARRLAKGKATLPELMAKVDFVAQFGAAHALHAEIAHQGETPQRIQSLARAYAQLSLLSQHTWNSTSEAFAARAMLYAQRSAIATDHRPDSLWTRAYVWALTGSWQNAEADLKLVATAAAANEPEPAGDNPPTPVTSTTSQESGPDDQEEGDQEEDEEEQEPPAGEFLWQDLIGPYIRCDRPALKQLAQGNQTLAPWARELEFQLVLAFRYPQWLYETGGQLMQVANTAYHAPLALAMRTSNLQISRTGAYYAPAYFGRNLPVSLGAIAHLPRTVESQLPIDAIRTGMLALILKDPEPHDPFSAFPSHIAKELRKAGPAEQSHGLDWSVLGYLVEEQQFLMAVAYLKASQHGTESDLDYQVDAILPLIKEHRYAPYVEAFRYHPRTHAAEREQLLQKISIRDPRGNMKTLLNSLPPSTGNLGDNSAQHTGSEGHYNFTMQGLLESAYPYDHGVLDASPELLPKLGEELSLIAPHLEVSARLLIRAEQSPTREKLARWESQIQVDPNAFAQLAAQYGKLDLQQEAIRCYEKSLAIFPTLDNTIALASLHWQRRDRQAWEKSLKKYLETDNYGLEHASIHNRLANNLAYLGEWQKARPHAIEAGDSFSSWGLKTASRVCEALAEWDDSEAWIRTASQNHPNSSGLEWFFWCCRTGRGDIDSARQLADQYFAQLKSQPTRTDDIDRGVYAFLNDRLEEARAAYRRANRATPEPSCSCTFMLIQLDRLLDGGEEQQLLAALKETLETYLATPDAQADLWRAALEIVALAESQAPSPERLEKLEQSLHALTDEPARGAFCYFAAKELLELGEQDLAERYLRRALLLPMGDPHYATLAGYELATWYGSSRPDEPVVKEEAIWPPREW